MTSYTEVLFEEMPGSGGNLGLITLNRPSVLNSLNHDMIEAIHKQLRVWAEMDQIKAVVIRAAEGRAFCAGGDIRLTYDRMKAHDPAMTIFFRDEYQLNRCIFHYPKPYIALLDGITMGGGVGISIHGSHRVCTDSLLFAMPETGIGFFPDVGGTYFLPRLPNNIGIYLGLTGARISSNDCLALGLATQKVAQAVLPELIEALAQQSFQHDPKAEVTKVIERFKVDMPTSALLEHQTAIRDCFAANTVEEILSALDMSQNVVCQDAATAMRKKSPTSLKITLHALREGKQLDFDASMRQEFRLVSRFLQGHDFAEGIRAVIIDKDQQPNWQPNELARVSKEMVMGYFAPLTAELV